MSKAKQLITVLPQRVTEIRSARREAMPRGKGDYISGRVAHVQVVSLRPSTTYPNGKTHGWVCFSFNFLGSIHNKFFVKSLQCRKTQQSKFSNA